MGDIGITSTPDQAFHYQRQVAVKRIWGETLPQAERTQIKKVAEQFEAMYLSDMMNYVMSDMDMSDTSFGGGTGEKMYQSLMANEYGKQFAKSGQVGIAPILEREMLKMQELQRNPRLANPQSSLSQQALHDPIIAKTIHTNPIHTNK
jgi:flagellar protein FlgJ